MDIEELRRLAAKHGLSLNYVAKDAMLTRALKCLEGEDTLILKGGTAINRVYTQNKRFSEDIDFDFIFTGSINEAIKRTDALIKKIAGFTVERPWRMKNIIRYDLFYNNPLNHKDRIMVEFNLIKNASHYHKKPIPFGFVPGETALLNVYDVDALIAQKKECILNRKEGKDLFDLYYLLDIPHKKISDKKEILRRIELEKEQITSMANILNHYVPRSQRPLWTLFVEELKEKIGKE